MGMSLLIICLALIIFAAEFPPLRKAKKKKEAAIFLSLLVIGISLGFANVMLTEVPSPLSLVEKVYKPFSSLIFGKKNVQ